MKSWHAMLAADTNVLVRVITDDDTDQATRALAWLKSDIVLIPTTVLLELEWVLRRQYKLDVAAVWDALRLVTSIEGVVLQDAEAVEQAFRWAEQGLDFADALHLTAARGCEVFGSFDRDLARRAAGLDAPPVRAP